MQPGRAADHLPPSSAVVTEEYLYPPSGPHWACNGKTLPFPFTMRTSNLTDWCVLFFFMCLKLGDIYQAHHVIINYMF